MNRRTFLHRAAGVAAAATLASFSPPLLAAATSGTRRRVLRVAHLTDLHVMSPAAGLEDPAGGMAAALRQSQAEQPDLLLFGGDMVMDSLEKTEREVNAQWDVWDRVFAAEVKTPYRLCLGNHDVWGWGRHDEPGIERHPRYGKALAMERLRMDRRYYAFDQAGWHFVVLDSIRPSFATGSGYSAGLDDEQFAWLAADLAKTAAATPIAVLSHVPIVCTCAFFTEGTEDSGSWLLPASYCHIDARRIKNLFHRRPNVKVCLSGHIHLADDVTYLGVRYLCNGAVCGNWWKGTYQEFPPAYAIVDFYDDGTVENRLVPYARSA